MIIEHPKHPKGGYYMEQALYDNIKELPGRVRRDKDVVAIFVGSPGEGKSTLAQQVLYFLDSMITVDSIKYSYEDYVRFCTALFNSAAGSKGKGVIHDEGKESLSAISVMSKRTRSFMNFLYENRQMNMYQFILSGDFFDIPKSIVMQRTMFMIWVHEGERFDNGHFKFYNRAALKRLYIYGKKERNMQASGYSFRGTFPKFYTVDEDAYRKLKKSHLDASRYIEEQKDKDISIKEVVKWVLNRNPTVTNKQIIDALSIDYSYFYMIKKELGVEE